MATDAGRVPTAPGFAHSSDARAQHPYRPVRIYNGWYCHSINPGEDTGPFDTEDQCRRECERLNALQARRLQL